MASLPVFILLFCFSPFSEVLGSEASLRHEQYLDLRKITDEEARIVAELQLSLLGPSEQAETSRIKSLQVVEKGAEEHPRKEADFTIVFSHGMPYGELGSLIKLNKFSSLSELQAKFLHAGLVYTVGLTGFDWYKGDPTEIIQFLMYQYRETLRAQISAAKSVGKDIRFDQLMLGQFENLSDVRFFCVHARMTFEAAEALRQHNSSSILYLGENHQRVVEPRSKGTTIPQFDPNTRLDALQPNSDILTWEDQRSALSGFQAIKSIVSAIVDNIISKANASPAVDCGRSGEEQCPPDSMWLPGDTSGSGYFLSVCVFASCEGRGSLITTSRFNNATDPSSNIPVQLWAYQNIGLPWCDPDFNGSTAHCSQPDSAFVSRAGFEHQISTYDHRCWAGTRSGSNTDLLFNCMLPISYSTNLPGHTYRGSTALDPDYLFVGEVGTHDGDLLLADVEYQSSLQMKSPVLDNIQPGDLATVSNSVMFILGYFADGLDEFIVDSTPGPNYLWVLSSF